eukprot:484435-Prymnesium_polylepis.1
MQLMSKRYRTRSANPRKPSRAGQPNGIRAWARGVHEFAIPGFTSVGRYYTTIVPVTALAVVSQFSGFPPSHLFCEYRLSLKPYRCTGSRPTLGRSRGWDGIKSGI